ncbi:MAG TPA: acetate--CoA ligase [Thermoanaerobaculia bacterium]|jgi:acetyl-CoA synthetase|nr:acetate--CoA ligase [Thermoanaerobaculia bacterium]
MADQFDALLQENRTFQPSEEFREQANVNDPGIWTKAAADREGYWANWASQLDWEKPWDRVLEWEPPYARWFVGGRLNASYNCVDRHLKERGEKTAIIWEGEPGEVRTYTYRQLHVEVSKFANALKSLGVTIGDRVAIYLPLIPEAVVAMLACARIGAVHSVVFGGFSAEALRDRIQDAEAKVLITATSGYRRGALVPLKKTADAAVAECPSIEKVVVAMRRSALDEADETISMSDGRDVWYHDVMQAASADCPPAWVDSEQMLYTLYTSGTTGKPKGIVHTTGGYLTGCYATCKWVFDLKESDVYWCTADIGWVTGHSYVVYGPLACGATVVIYEGAPDWPKKDRFWELIEKHKVTIFYTAPTAIRAFMKWGEQLPRAHDLSSLRLLGSVGEPINPEAWIWYHKNIGNERCPVVDTWWQTETGAILITPLPGLTATKPGSATRPFPGIDAEILDQKGERVAVGGGYLVITSPWPSMLRGIYNDPDRYKQQYWSKWPGIYFTGDGAKRDEDGYFWLLGRVDDVMNVAGHRIGTMEVESALVDHPSVAEAACVGISHEIKGTAIAAFVIVKESGRELAMRDPAKFEQELKQHVAEKIGAIARPEKILITADLPKTRSGKIMRRLLRDIAEGRALGDVTTLADPTVVASLKEKYEEEA